MITASAPVWVEKCCAAVRSSLVHQMTVHVYARPNDQSLVRIITTECNLQIKHTTGDDSGQYMTASECQVLK
jgi:hypothetical protein